MTTKRVAGAAFLTLFASYPAHTPVADPLGSKPTLGTAARAGAGEATRQRLRRDDTAQAFAHGRYDLDLDAMRTYRPGYPFWHHVLTVPNGRMAFGSAADGRLLATFPNSADWTQQAHWVESSLAELLADQPLGGGLAERRDATAVLLAQMAGPIVYHETRGSFITEGTRLYGGFLAEWGAIFERFGVPAEVGLAQALVESGLKGRVRSEAEAIGLCQWLPRNWARLQRLSPYVIEAYNQTTQVPYCAAHLAILATKYGSFIPALSEHHAGGVNVGRTIISGDFAGGDDVRARYFLGAELALLVRQIRPPGYREIVGSYGPRSFRYAEMVFGNTLTVNRLEAALHQERIFAMRPSRSISLDDVTRRTGLSVDEVRRFNPALINRVPATANLYLPFHVDEFGDDTAFWHRAPSTEYAVVLNEFLRLEDRYAIEDWHDGSVIEALHAFETRFRATGTEEGTVMAVALGYVIEELGDGRQTEILTEFRGSERVFSLLEESVRQREALLPAAADSGGRASRNALLTTASFTVR
jgi:hypothetical protein